jgi:excisionase family DNA binding protein
MNEQRDLDQLSKATFSISETADLLGVTRRTVHRAIERGDIVTVKPFKQRRVPYREIERHLKIINERVTPARTQEVKK